MKVLAWLRRVLCDRDQPTEAAQARALANRISERADDLGKHLSAYKRARDPFAAMMADLYNRDQVEQIWRGDSRE